MSPFDLDGMPAARFFGRYFSRIAVAPDGGLVTTADDLGSDDDKRFSLSYVAPSRPKLLAMALDGRAGRATNTQYLLRYRVTRPVVAEATVRRVGGGVAYRQRGHAGAGLATLRLRHAFRFGTYDVRLVVRRPDGADADDSVRLFLGGTLPLRYARGVLVPKRYNTCTGFAKVADADPCEPDLLPVRSGGCRRFGAQRVDCRWSYRYVGGEPVCVMASAQLHRDGLLRVSTYECPSTRTFPLRPPKGELRRVLPEQP